MKDYLIAPMAAEEPLRLESLRLCNVLDTDAEPAFDDLTLLVAAACNVPVALVSLVDETRQWFKSRVGLDVSETSRDMSFCAHAILQPDELFIVNDTHTDERFRGNPLVTEPPYVRFYAGVPLVSADGHALGSLCVLDTEPRTLDDQQRMTLVRAARQVEALLEARKEQFRGEASRAGLQSEVESLRTRMQQRAEFLATAEHTLKSPITVLSGWVGMLSGGKLSEDMRTEAHGALDRSVKELSRRLDALLEAARAEVLETTLDIVEVDLVQVVEAEIEELSVVSVAHPLVLDASVSDAVVLADREALHQVITHLIDNAVKYCPGGGPVTVAISRHENGVEVSVSDEGIGIPADLDVFEPFARSAVAKATAPGSGVGLHLVRSLVGAMHGTITARANDGPGSTFTVVLPAPASGG